MKIETTIARRIGIIRVFGLFGVLRGIGALLPVGSGSSRRGLLFIFSFSQFFIVSAFAQAPRIGGNVYGGGNQADVDGSTKVTIVAGDIGVRPAETEATIDKVLDNPRGKVFGGARMANVGGNTFVHIDGEHATDYIVANYVYGGNDIAGTVGTAAAVGEEMPAELTAVKREPEDEGDSKKNAIDNTWNSYVRISSKTKSNSNYSDEEAATYNSGLTGAIAEDATLTSDQITAVNTALSLTGDAAYSESNKDISAADAKLYNATLPGAVSTGDMKSSAKIYIGQLFAGGNGDYEYDSSNDDETNKTTHYIYDKKNPTTPIATKVTNKGETGFTQPELLKTYLEVKGGSIVYAYGGGNNATVMEEAVIHVDNPSPVVNDITDSRSITADNKTGELLTTGRFLDMGINMGFSYPSSDAFQVGRFFGGNNQAEMAIRPKWNLLDGKIRNLYSGGNQGNMTHPNGIFLEIPEASTLVVDNLYGGCRMADVRPKNADGTDVSVVNNDIPGTQFPLNLAARVLVRGGDVNNVYGGNDVRGRVYFGNAVGIYTNVRGNIYGGGNGAYPYTDNVALKDDPTYSDLYYNPTEVLTEAEITPESGLESVTALNEVRPNAEQVSIRLAGTSEANPTIIGGSVYVGGNCATLKSVKYNPLIELKIGSYVIADKVYLGNNGEGMVTEDMLMRYAGGVDSEGKVVPAGSGTDFSSINLTESDQMASYMEGVALNKLPSLVFDQEPKDPATYIDYTSYIGSLFCGGNVGSMTYEGTNTMTFYRNLIVYNKVVGGCNNANVPETEFNADYKGGIKGTLAERTETSGKTAFEGQNRLVLNFNNLKIQPKRLYSTEYVALTSGTELTAGETYYTSDAGDGKFVAVGTEELATGSNWYEERKTRLPELAWNTAKWKRESNGFIEIGTGSSSETGDDDDRRLMGGNIYGGCYNSGHVNGNVVININEDVIEKDDIFAGISNYDEDNDEYTIDESNRRSGVILDRQSFDVNTLAMTIFGAGYGKDTEIWGSTTVNHNNGYCFQIFGGGEKGVVGKSIASALGGTSEHEYTLSATTGLVDKYIFNDRQYEYNEAYSTNVNLKGRVSVNNEVDIPEGEFPEAEYLYAGGNEGPVCGNTLVNLGNGRIYDSFGGASDAFILGNAETYIGRSGVDGSGGDIKGFPYIRDIVYGANDFGGKILRKKDFTTRVREGARDMLHDTDANDDGIKDVLQTNAYVEYIEGHVDEIFAGCYGDYDYGDPDYEPTSGRPDINAAFAYIRPVIHNDNLINKVFGGSEGHSHDREGDRMQDRSYVLVDIPDEMEKFRTTEVFGAGKNNGIGMNIKGSDIEENKVHPDGASAIIDLVRGQIANAFGGSYAEGITRRTVVNVPEHSTIRMYTEEPARTKINEVTVILPQERGNIFGGAYGTQILPPCDVFESNVNYCSEDAVVNGAIYGGNNMERRTLRTKVNISAPVWSTEKNGYTGTVFGAGKGKDTWAEYTEVNLENGANVYEVYGGGLAGHVLNAESVWKYMNLYKGGPSEQIERDDPYWSEFYRAGDLWNVVDGENVLKDKHKAKWAEDWEDAWTFGDYYEPKPDGVGVWTNYVNNAKTNLNESFNRPELSDAKLADQFGGAKRFNANVIIKPGAYVGNYAYGGGFGRTDDPLSGDIYGTSYIALLGGEVKKDIYASGTAGSVYDLFGVGAYDASTNQNGFTATANAFIKGGTVRNVYGGGWRGSVGYAKYREGDIIYSDDESGTVVREKIPDFWDEHGNYTDILGVANVVIGTPDGTSHVDGIPSITRNVYGGGEGGAIYGTANVVINNGYIGYRYKNTGTEESPAYAYVEEVDDAPGDGKLEKRSGSVFGGGYVCNSYVDVSNVKLYDGIIRGSLFGGGEIGPIGRGTVRSGAPDKSTLPYTFENYDAKIYKGGETHVEMFGGHVMHSVYGGGRGRDNWGTYGWITSLEEATLDQSSRGYVFGSTDVRIHGGEIGTAIFAIQGYGNVFGGGEEGFVYSATGTKKGEKVSDDNLVNGMPDGGGGYYYKENDISKGLTLDCNVVIEPYCEVKGGMILVKNNITKTETEGGATTTTTLYAANSYITTEQYNAIPDDVRSGLTEGVDWQSVSSLNIKDGEGAGAYSKNFAVGSYVRTEDLNRLRNRKGSPEWDALDTRGVLIHNAVFAGGNIPAGSDILMANTVTIYGNAAASLRDVFNYDLITLGSDELGGLYGDGNLTLVGGFRELHVDSYGTDYYSLDNTMTLEEYELLSDRQKAYYQLRYVTTDGEGHTYSFYECKENHTYSDQTYKRGQKVTEATYLSFSSDEKEKWVPGRKDFQKDEQIDAGEWLLMDATEQAKWQLFGVCSIYAGRPLNTLQRADFCGVFGSRMVLKGAEDRVSTSYDHTNYTINRVDEVSLNQKYSINTADLAINPETDQYVDLEMASHGNYFGIYSVVNYLGNLTSDVFFDDVRVTDSKIEANKGNTKKTNTPYGTASYYKWKSEDPLAKNRNNATSRNMVALASGVYLEIKREETETAGEDKWGYITGVVELDLINVMTGMGGGYVYARNEHGEKAHHTEWGKVTLLEENMYARTYRRFTYDEDASKLEDIETSGNFVHNVKQIIDDCYPNGGIYKDGYVKSPAHYWFIKGSIYVYDQYISAYTGSANAYAETVDIPLTISAASNGKLKLREVQPNYYAYYDKNGNKIGDPGVDDVFVANGITYKLNDPISYWQYRLLTEGEKAKFVEETYVTIAECKIGETTYPEGYVMLPSEYTALSNSVAEKDFDPDDGVEKLEKYVYSVDEEKDVRFDYVFRPSNNMSHDTGYILTYDVNNPMVWNNYYTKTEDPDQAYRLNTDQYSETTSQNLYTEGPTYSVKTGDAGFYGQHNVTKGQIINADVYTEYETSVSDYSSHSTEPGYKELTGQAKVEKAYVVLTEISVKDDSDGTETNQLNPGLPIVESDYTPTQWDSFSGKIEEAKVCTSLLKFSEDDYVYAGKILTSADIATLKAKVITANSTAWSELTAAQKDAKATEFLSNYVADAYYCTESGLYGGMFYQEGVAYRALDTFSDMTADDRRHFTFNYDALDLLIDPTYDNRLESHYGDKPQYDGPNSPKIYSVETPIDYRAEFIGVKDNEVETITYYDKENALHSITESSAEEDWLSREAYEAIPNEQHYYSPIIVKEPGKYYVVKNPFLRGDIPYSVGETITGEVFDALTDKQKMNIDILEFTRESGLLSYSTSGEGDDIVYTYDPVTYYYCRKGYTVNEKGEGVAVTAQNKIGIYEWNNTSGTYSEQSQGTTTDDTYGLNTSVPEHIIINTDQYNSLPNKQKGFAIHGTAPTETSTLYVSSESDIFDLSKEKIITVIYLYEYEESDESGTNVMPMSERHIVNIHINFRSGVPEIGKLKKPDLVLPGTAIGMEIPTVKEGAYRVTDSGWEIFASQHDADTHTNGQPYYNNLTPVYLYQDNYYIAYYAETYLGKTYSNSVPFSVGNYHDLKKVMDAKEHHYYIDHKKVIDKGIEPKIYINDYSSSGKNGLDIFKSLYDLSVLSSPSVDGDDLINSGTFEGHKPLNSRVAAGKNLEFFLRTDIDHSTKPNPDYDSSDPDSPETIPALWTPIGTDAGTCFEGTLHGDGHHLSGLSNSLFNHLCGDVYNLGVSGTFTGAGIAETGNGYVENSWISSSSDDDKTTQPVFGNPNRTGEKLEKKGPVQVVNSYYQEEESVALQADGVTPAVGSYTKQISDHNVSTKGTPTRKSVRAFYNGEVAYDLNGFYLYKRYTQKNGSKDAENLKRRYFTIDDDNKLALQEYEVYESHPELCSTVDNGLMYVEDRFADGDFRYAEGTIPTTDDERYKTWTVEDPLTYKEIQEYGWFPIYPDDYIFFGQKLTYGHMLGQTHQDVPTSVNRTDGRIDYTESSNRVYRAPAYYRSSEMKMAHFNPNAVFAQKSADGTREAYPEMTAIDFTGYNDVNYDYVLGWQKWSKTSTTPQSEAKSVDAYAFYPPLLDDDGLTGFVNRDETKNLLVYVPQPGNTAQTKTHNVVTIGNTDPDFAETDAKYRTVDQNSADVDYHIVERTANDATTYQSIYDHFLVDKQDFNAPIKYTFDEDHRMWYQRMPVNYVGKRKDGSTFIDSNAGWEGVSLPFSAELVTTDRKGEITHFYDGSETSKNGTDTKIGHEYWLRELENNGTMTLKEGTTDVLVADFLYPAISGDGSEIIPKKWVENTFLWDYYYRGLSHDHKDKNDDTYQTYYSVKRSYDNYAMQTRGIPYIIGFPGERYYEFDLSGTFDAANTAATKPDKIDKQVITFASNLGETIYVSDGEKAGRKVSYGGKDYFFKPSYLNEKMKADVNYALNAAGSSYELVEEASPVTAVAFRPYFDAFTGSSGAKEYKAKARSIVFSMNTAEIHHQEESDDISKTGDLLIRGNDGRIFVTSTLQEAKEVVIVTASGALVDRYTIQPGETRETRVTASGVYLVNKKKLSMKIGE